MGFEVSNKANPVKELLDLVEKAKSLQYQSRGLKAQAQQLKSYALDIRLNSEEIDRLEYLLRKRAGLFDKYSSEDDVR